MRWPGVECVSAVPRAMARTTRVWGANRWREAPAADKKNGPRRTRLKALNVLEETSKKLGVVRLLSTASQTT